MNAIEVQNLEKIYRLYPTPMDRLKELLIRKKRHRDFYALNDVSFIVEKGQRVGIIGQNGSGKSTLLKIICGVLRATNGRVHTNGRIAALLELGAGFNPEFTGRENVYMNGALLGFSRSEMERRFPKIEAFAEIGDFIDRPVKTYSSGMFVRLAFSTAINVDPEILVIDEALSVGDMYFHHRCVSKMESFRDDGITILLVTHDINLVKGFCDKAMLMSAGKLVASGDPEYITEQYMMETRQRQARYASKSYRIFQAEGEDSSGSKIRFGSEAGKILNINTLDRDRKDSAVFWSGDTIVLSVKVQVDSKVKTPRVAFTLRDQRGYSVYSIDTVRLGLQLELNGNNQAVVFFSFSPVLAPGSYSFAVRIEEYWSPKFNMLLDKRVGVGVFQVIQKDRDFGGIVDLQAKAFQSIPEIDRIP